MQTRLCVPVLLALFAIGSVLCQNADELHIPVETNNQFPPEYSESDNQSVGKELSAAESTQPTPTSTSTDVFGTLAEDEEDVQNKEIEIPIMEPLQIIADSTTTINSTTLNSNASVEITTASFESTTASIETTTAEPTQITLELTTDVGEESLGPISESDNESIDSETTTIEPSQITSEPVGETTLQPTVNELEIPELTNGDEKGIDNEVIETTTAEDVQITSQSPIEETASPFSSNEDGYNNDSEFTTQIEELVTNNEDSITTTPELTQTMSDLLSDLIDEISETTLSPVSPLRSIDLDVASSKSSDANSLCPEPCVCITEGDSSDYIVDCSGHSLTDLPTSVDPKTTTLRLQNNLLTVIPERISELKNLKNLNLNDNLISELESGSVSELTELVSLQLGNNRLLEYPKDLENALKLDKLEELHLAGNELKTTPTIFFNLKNLQKVILPEVSGELVSQLCSFKETLITVCTKSCLEQSTACSDVRTENKLLDATLPGLIPFSPEIAKESTKEFDDILTKIEKSDVLKESNNLVGLLSPIAKDTDVVDPLAIPSIPEKTENSDTPLESVPEVSTNTQTKEPLNILPKTNTPDSKPETKNNLPVNDFSLRNAFDNAPQEKVLLQSIGIETPKESTNKETEVKVGAKTTETKGGGGVDKSVIAVIVAGMVIIVAVIAIKKNWSSIRKRFSSTPRAGERTGTNVNGTTVPPEEVPLQDKSPA